MHEGILPEDRGKTRVFSIASFAERYDAVLVPALFRDSAAAILEGFDLSPSSRLLDLACGTGVVARLASEHPVRPQRIVGVDVSPEMLDVARGTDDSVEWKVADATHLPFSGGDFTAAVLHQGMQFLPDPSAALREMYRVLAPAGLLAVSTWGAIDSCPAYAALLTAVAKEGWVDTARALRRIFGMAGSEVAELVEHAGFGGVREQQIVVPAQFESTDEFVKFYRDFPPMSDDWQRAGAASRETIIETVRAVVRPWESAEGMHAPMTCAVVWGTRPDT